MMTVIEGSIVLMGSGELTATMVEVHKELLERLPAPAQAVFLDTPAGFQLNCDQISEKAVTYFKEHVGHLLAVASIKSAEANEPFEHRQALNQLRQADYILIGPGSPTYAVQQWQRTPVPDILSQMVHTGGCLVAASAAALTIGRFTLPVYEIYKVGQEPHWLAGLNLLEDFGLNLVVIPHWNNAEGGTHDTRCCFMGEPRFHQLSEQLPSDVSILGIDEHTACIINLYTKEITIKGLGQITLRNASGSMVFDKGDRFPLNVFQGAAFESSQKRSTPETIYPTPDAIKGNDAFWDQIHSLRNAFQLGLNANDLKQVTNALLEMDSTIWRAHGQKESEELISQARELLRDSLVDLGSALSGSPISREACLSPLIRIFVDLREVFRKQKKWHEADEVRSSLSRCGVIINDTPAGPRWQLTD